MTSGCGGALVSISRRSSRRSSSCYQDPPSEEEDNGNVDLLVRPATRAVEHGAR
jgi:hypothetical protein